MLPDNGPANRWELIALSGVRRDGGQDPRVQDEPHEVHQVSLGADAHDPGIAGHFLLIETVGQSWHADLGGGSNWEGPLATLEWPEAQPGPSTGLGNGWDWASKVPAMTDQGHHCNGFQAGTAHRVAGPVAEAAACPRVQDDLSRHCVHRLHETQARQQRVCFGMQAMRQGMPKHLRPASGPPLDRSPWAG